MAVTGIVWEWRDRGGKVSIDGTDDTRVALIGVSSRYDSMLTILQSGILPTYLSPHPDNPFYSYREADIKPIGPYVWRAVCRYSDKPLSAEEKERKKEPNPCERKADVSWKTHHYQEGFYKDLDNKAVVNSAGDFPIPTPPIDRSYRVAHVVKNVPDVPTWLDDYELAINSDHFVIDGRAVAPQKARLSGLDISSFQEENGYRFRVLSFDLEIRKLLGWAIEFVDRGLRKKVGTSLETIFDNSTPKRPITTPVLLDGDGLPLDDPGPDTAKYMSYRGYNYKPFNDLPLT